MINTLGTTLASSQLALMRMTKPVEMTSRSRMGTLRNFSEYARLMPR